ncbi:sensor histidine kinase KdpD [Methylocystis sp. SC2]|uniref:sensor histidine kinase n=1 Tax=Methylocystis sp. (strain SC2) TaxID=187303 RepID=UPI00027AE893|nr:sensor histidine kinase KdpD [Methylocystis sp. SC2]CCJ07937.1 Osmosensitive K channel His kinase sensor [Methylocystis sp. SC2]
MARDDGDFDRRPDPDALLALSDKESKGKLRVFLGAAPGVGKTYAMLARAQTAKAEGVDVVVGVAETHGRAETQALLNGLETLPRRKCDYRGRIIEEFDIDAALARKPQLILVDELAHTNAPDSRHPKRWQDVEELLDVGIDIWTTLNVQHLESLADVVSRVTGVAVRETVPDRVLQNAADVILVDITPEELLQRLKDGKVYVPETARRATQNFFTPRNLTALRELALRRTAERVDDQMVDFLRQGAIEGPWATSERLLVCVGRDANSEAVVRAGARLATALNATWIALYVERGGQDEDSAEVVRSVDQALRLAERLGAEIARTPGDDLAGEALSFARRENITQIVLGRSRARPFSRLLRRSLTDEILRRSTDIAVHVVVQEDGPPQSRQAWKLPTLSQTWLGFGGAAVSVMMTVLVGHGLERWLGLVNPSVVFLLPVVLCAVWLGMWSAIIAAVLSFLACDFFFFSPRYELTISQPQEFLTLVVALVVAVITGMLASKMRTYAQNMRQRSQAVQSLFEFSRKLSTITTLDDILWASTLQIQKAGEASSVIMLIPEEGGLKVSAAWPPVDRMDAGELAAARWALEKSEPAGWRTDTLPNVRFQFRPLATARGVVAVCGIEPKTPEEPLSAAAESTISSLLEQTAIAIDRSMLVGESVKAAALEENEKLRTILLSALSHDLRTPLTSITGAVTSLRELGEKLPPEDRKDLLLSIEEEAGRLSRFIANMLDMSRIESGALAPRSDLVDVAEVIRSVLERAKRSFPGKETSISIAPDLPPIRGDANLLGQVLFNLIDNAHKYGGPAGAIVHARREGGDVVITVTDEGPGVKTADIERIFEKFYRSGRVDGRKAGTGLGLSICRGLVRAMGGTIVAQSPAARRRGTRLIMRFPAAGESRRGVAA